MLLINNILSLKPILLKTVRYTSNKFALRFRIAKIAPDVIQKVPESELQVLID